MKSPEEILNFRNAGCKSCICRGCKDNNTKYCKNYCDKCDKVSGKLRRKRCIYTPEH